MRVDYFAAFRSLFGLLSLNLNYDFGCPDEFKS